MFTGLVEAVGTVTKVGRTAVGIELRIECPWSDVSEGESISVNGACLTVLEHGPMWFTVAAMEATVGRTTIGEWQEGRRVNLERAMPATGRLGGHIVQGHVDGVGTVTGIERGTDAVMMNVAIARELAETAVLHGSIAIDGVSLTVNDLDGANLQVALISYTLQHTALGDLSEGSKVHVETDVIGKYVRGLTAPYLNRKAE